jgi:hypothetical protein
VDRFHVWLEEDVTYLFISYSLVCGKVLLKIYGMGHKIAALKEKIKLRKCPAYLQKTWNLSTCSLRVGGKWR